MTGQRQPDVDIAGHLDLQRRTDGDVRPVRPIGRMLCGERVVRPRQLDPVRRRRAGRVGVGAGLSGDRTPLEADAVVRRHRHEGVLRAGFQRLANHHARFGPFVAAFESVDAGDDRAVAAEALVGKAELIGGVPDVRPDRAHHDALGGLDEGRCVASEVDRQRGCPVRRPVLGRFEVAFGFGIPGRDAVVVLQRHGLPAAVDDRLLRERRVEVADRRAGAVDPSIHPRVEDGFPGIDVVGVGLEPVDHRVLFGREAPEIAFPYADRLSLVDLDDLPEVGASEFQTCGDQARLSGRAGQRQRRLIGTEVDLMGDRLSSGLPSQDDAGVHVGGAVGRLRLLRVDGNLEEPHFAQAVLAHDAIAAVDGQADVPGGHTAEIHRRVGGIVGLRCGLGKLDVTQTGPVRAVLGVLDGDIFQTEAEDQLELHVVVPDQHLIELLDSREFVLDPGGLAGRRCGQPHVLGRDRVLVLGIESGPVDGVLDGAVFLAGRIGRRDDVLDGVGEGLGGKGPDISLVDRVVRRRVDLVDSPVVRLIEFQASGRIERCGALALADQHAQRIGPTGIANVVEDRAEVDVVRVGKLAGRPCQDNFSRNVRVAVRWIGGRGLLAAAFGENGGSPGGRDLPVGIAA